MSLLERLAQAFCTAVRFSELRVASTVFQTSPVPLRHLLKRRVFGSTLVLDVSRETQQLVYLSGERVVPERYFVKRLLRHGMHVVDVGANIGYYTSLFQSVIGPEGHVTCIEPSPENLVELHDNIRENGWSNVTLHECAVGNQTATVGLRWGVNSGVVALSEGYLQATMCPLDSLVPDKCDFLKIDVDGYEWLVLQGARNVIERDKPILFLEYHPELVGRHGGSLTEILPFLRAFYHKLEFFDIPSDQPFRSKLGSRYFGVDSVRQIDIAGIPEERLHEGRLHGTLWIVAS